MVPQKLTGYKPTTKPTHPKDDQHGPSDAS